MSDHSEPLFTELSARRLGPVRAFFVRRPVAMDVLVMAWFVIPALLTAVVAAGTTPAPEPGVAIPPSDEAAFLVRGLVGLLLVILGAVALFWRRRWPVHVLAVITALGAACTLVTGSTLGFDLALALALYAVAASRPTSTTWLSFAAAISVMSGAVWLWDRTLLSVGTPDEGNETSSVGTRIAGIIVITIFALVALAIGTSVRGRRQHVADLVNRANALARDRDQQAQLARAAERSRIAREMHDVVAHSLSVMIALADGAGAALARSPESSKVALDELSSTGRAALADMRRVLGVLDEPEAPFEPQPDSEDLACLVDRFRAAGMTVMATGLSTPLPADAGFQLAVYRIVQEALTNALRHAPGTARADVVLERTGRNVEVTITDQGPGLVLPDQQAGSGRGVIGMRERVGVYGGMVEAGPWGGGWRVHAVLPWVGPEVSDDGVPGDRGTRTQRDPGDPPSPAPEPQTAVGPVPQPDTQTTPPVPPRSDP
ncbi:MAG: two-component sensor histidine kinase [Actinomycetales bacterium]|nr:two-component sensor histidine kinase [Actinomycetales bacterium]